MNGLGPNDTLFLTLLRVREIANVLDDKAAQCKSAAQSPQIEPLDAAEQQSVAAAYEQAAASLWELLGGQPGVNLDKAITLHADLARGVLADLVRREALSAETLEQQTAEMRRMSERLATLEALLRERPTKRDGVRVHRVRRAQRALYIAGGSSERLTVCRPWITRAQEAGAYVVQDWTRADGYDDPSPPDELLRDNADRDVHSVLSADVLWVLAPEVLSEGAATELGVALGAARMPGGWDGRIIISGPNARRNIFAHLADALHATHEQAWEEIRPLVLPAGTFATV